MEITHPHLSLFSLMDHSLHMIFSFVGIIKDTLKLFPSNSKFLLIVAILTSSINSIIFLLNVFSIRPSISELIAKQSLLPITTPGTPEFISLLLSIKEDIIVLFGVEWIFVLIQFISAAFVATTIILATSALTVDQKAMSLKDLLLKAIKALKRPLVTWFYTTLLACGYMVVFIVILIPIFLLIDSPSKPPSAISVLLILIVAGLYTYVSVVWTLSVVVSVIEEKSGIEALGKASVVIKGFKLDGFMINLVFTIVSYGLFEGSKFLLLHHGKNNSVGILISIGLVVVNFISLAKMFWLMTFSVLYYKCKENHGDEFELQGSAEYFKVPATPMIIAEDMA